MTIQRQYVLPNCSLVLEGLSADTSSVLSILANAEFKIVGIEQTLAGGSEFFQAVVGAVSAYCQSLLSGLNHPDHTPSQSSLVSVEPGEGQYHRLLIKPQLLDQSAANKTSQTINLSTVQLFDMAEAIDQFYADNQTLPNFSVRLAPLPRKYVRAAEPLTKRAIPPLLGFGTLAIAALGLFFLPVPELVEPEPLESQPTAPLEDSGSSDAGSTAGPDPSSTSAEPTADTANDPTDDQTSETGATAAASDANNDSETLDGAQLAALQQQVQQQIGEALPADSTFEQPLRYQISVTENGDIIGYNPLDAASLENVDNTSLPGLTYIPVDSVTIEPAAQFDVTFDADGTVVVVPNSETAATDTATSSVIAPEATTPEATTPDVVIPEPATTEDLDGEANDDTDDDATDASPVSSASSGTLSDAVESPIQGTDRIYDLNQDLRRTIIDSRDPDRSGPEISYRVRLDESGNVTGYEAMDATSEQYAADVNISSLVEATTVDQPQLDFLVVIGSDNVVEVSPWDGWP